MQVINKGRYMNKITLAALLLVGAVSHAQAGDSDKQTLSILPISGVNLLVTDILERENAKGNPAAENTPEDDNSFENFKRKQMEEFEAFKRGGPSPQAIAARNRADAKALSDRIEAEGKRLQASLQWALHDGLQNYYQIINDRTAKVVAKGSLGKRGTAYLLALTIQNSASKKVIFEKSALCENCNEIQVGIKFKDLGSAAVPEPAPAVVVDAPHIAPLPQASPTEAAEENCYADDFVKVCLVKAVGKKNKRPSLSYIVKNLTDETVFIGMENGSFKVSDDAGNVCSYVNPNGVTFTNSKNEGDYSRIPKGGALKFNWVWGNCGSATGSELQTGMIFYRLKDGEINRFNVGITISDWK